MHRGNKEARWSRFFGRDPHSKNVIDDCPPRSLSNLHISHTIAICERQSPLIFSLVLFKLRPGTSFLMVQCLRDEMGVMRGNAYEC